MDYIDYDDNDKDSDDHIEYQNNFSTLEDDLKYKYDVIKEILYERYFPCLEISFLDYINLIDGTYSHSRNNTSKVFQEWKRMHSEPLEYIYKLFFTKINKDYVYETFYKNSKIICDTYNH